MNSSLSDREAPSDEHHTPGPWQVEDSGTGLPLILSVDSDADEYGRTRFSAVKIAEINDVSEFEANARLIAAAPDLLAALKNVMDLLDKGVLVRDITKDGNSDWAIQMLNLVRDMKNWQLAIAKATQAADTRGEAHT